MRMRLLAVSAVSASIAVAFIANTFAQGQPAAPGARTAAQSTGQAAAAEKPAGQTVRRRPANASRPVSLASRTAACKLDCSSGNLHGTYRAYGANDPQLKSPESK